MDSQGVGEMAIIQKFSGDEIGWQAVGNVGAAAESLVNIVWAFAEMDRGVAYRAVDIRKIRGKEELRITELTPILCAATIDIEYHDEFGDRPFVQYRPNLR